MRSIAHELAPIADLIAGQANGQPITEVCINRPNEVWVESDAGWQRIERALPLVWAQGLAAVIAHENGLPIGPKAPILHGTLPGGERVCVVVPPACEFGTVAITIRVPARAHRTHAELVAAGLYRPAAEMTAPVWRAQLREAYAARDWERLVPLAVANRLNVIVAGATGSGKTTTANALFEFVPDAERVVTLENAIETRFAPGRNVVRLAYVEEGEAGVDATVLMRTCLRMKPDRVILSEMRGASAYPFLKGALSGHPGSIAGVHAGSCEQALSMVALLVAEHPMCRMSPDQIAQQVVESVDVVVQMKDGLEAGRKVRRVVDVYWKDAPP